MFGRRAKAKAAEKWATQAAAFLVGVLDWQLTVAKEIPLTIKTRDQVSRALLLTAETVRATLEARRQELLLEAVKLGIKSPDLPEPVWPDKKLQGPVSPP